MKKLSFQTGQMKIYSGLKEDLFRELILIWKNSSLKLKLRKSVSNRSLTKESFKIFSKKYI